MNKLHFVQSYSTINFQFIPSRFLQISKLRTWENAPLRKINKIMFIAMIKLCLEKNHSKIWMNKTDPNYVISSLQQRLKDDHKVKKRWRVSSKRINLIFFSTLQNKKKLVGCLLFALLNGVVSKLEFKNWSMGKKTLGNICFHLPWIEIH